MSTQVTDVTAQIIPLRKERAVIPPTIEEAAAVLQDDGLLATASGWRRAAIVWAWTEPGAGGPRTDPKTGQLGLRQFAELGIHGLTKLDSVRKYRQAWQWAIEAELASPARPGESYVTPTLDWALRGRPAKESADSSTREIDGWQCPGCDEWTDGRLCKNCYGYKRLQDGSIVPHELEEREVTEEEALVLKARVEMEAASKSVVTAGKKMCDLTYKHPELKQDAQDYFRFALDALQRSNDWMEKA